MLIKNKLKKNPNSTPSGTKLAANFPENNPVGK